jgi:hypothetical protein
MLISRFGGVADQGTLAVREPQQTEIREQLAKALERVAATEAKTPRGEAVKLKHALLSEPQKTKLRERADSTRAGRAEGLDHARLRPRAHRTRTHLASARNRAFILARAITSRLAESATRAAGDSS